MRDFEDWLNTFTDSIATYEYYVDFKKIYRNVNEIKIELNILNSLIGSKNIESDFENIINKYPEVIKCIPILLAIRKNEIKVIDDKEYNFNFLKPNYSNKEYKNFMRKTGLFDLLENHIIKDLTDYVTGVETGLDSNGRKNRGGHIMEDLVESFIKINNFEYYKEMYSFDIEKKWNLDLSPITNNGETNKRFDFVIKTNLNIYAIETNFYTGGGSKLNETARSYKTLALESKKINNFEFVWFTDGLGWFTTKNNLKETFDVLVHLYNINDLQNNILGTF